MQQPQELLVLLLIIIYLLIFRRRIQSIQEKDTLSSVLARGNNAEGKSIDGVATLEAFTVSLTEIEDATGSQGMLGEALFKGANGAEWGPVLTPPLGQVLEAGNDAQGRAILNVGVTDGGIGPARCIQVEGSAPSGSEIFGVDITVSSQSVSNGVRITSAESITTGAQNASASAFFVKGVGASSENAVSTGSGFRVDQVNCTSNLSAQSFGIDVQDIQSISNGGGNAVGFNIEQVICDTTQNQSLSRGIQMIQVLSESTNGNSISDGVYVENVQSSSTNDSGKSNGLYIESVSSEGPQESFATGIYLGKVSCGTSQFTEQRAFGIVCESVESNGDNDPSSIGIQIQNVTHDSEGALGTTVGIDINQVTGNAPNGKVYGIRVDNVQKLLNSLDVRLSGSIALGRHIVYGGTPQLVTNQGNVILIAGVTPSITLPPTAQTFQREPGLFFTFLNKTSSTVPLNANVSATINGLSTFTIPAAVSATNPSVTNVWYVTDQVWVARVFA